MRELQVPNPPALLESSVARVTPHWYAGLPRTLPCRRLDGLRNRKKTHVLQEWRQKYSRMPDYLNGTIHSQDDTIQSTSSCYR